MKFREFALTFRVSENDTADAVFTQDETDKSTYQYPSLKKTLGAFSIEVEGGQFKQSEIMMLLG